MAHLKIILELIAKLRQDTFHREFHKRDAQSLASKHPLSEPFDHRSDDPWGETGKLTELVASFLARKEAQARAGGNEGLTRSIVCGRRHNLKAFLEQQEIYLAERHEGLAKRRRDMIACHAPDICDDVARDAIIRDPRNAELYLKEFAYQRDRRQLTYLTHYSRMHDPNFSMQSWMMHVRKQDETVRFKSYEFACFGTQAGGFYKPIAAFIWQAERLSLKE